MPKPEARNPASAKGDWFIDDRCIDCAASREVAPGLIVERGGKSVFARQPVTEDDTRAAWRAALLCPTASIGKEGRREQPPDLFPQELERGIYRCGYNARSSFGAHSYFIQRKEGNVLIDSPRYVAKLVEAFERMGGLADVLLSHQDDVSAAVVPKIGWPLRLRLSATSRRLLVFALRYVCPLRQVIEPDCCTGGREGRAVHMP
jgi:ferredoxin